MVARSNKGTFILAILLEALEHHLGDPFTRTRTRTAQPLPVCWSLCPKIGKVASPVEDSTSTMLACLSEDEGPEDEDDNAIATPLAR